MSNLRSNIDEVIDDQIGDDDEFDPTSDIDLDDDLDGDNNDDDGSNDDVSDLGNEEPSQDRQSGSRDQNEASRRSQGQEGDQLPPGIKKVGQDYVDGKGNVVDKTGKLIASAGSERRHFIEARAAKAENENLKSQLTRATAALDQAKEFVDLPQKLGISPDEYRDALDIAKQFSSDPVAAAKEVVARALALGHNVTDILGDSVGNSVDMVALRRMQEELHARPAREREENERRQRETNDRATEQYNSFISKYPDAVEHENAIAHLMNQGDNAEVAYLKIRSFAIENGFDFSKPLGPQINARAEESLGKDRRQQPNGQRNRRPLNGGQGRTSETRMTDRPTEFGADASYQEIIREALGSAKR